MGLKILKVDPHSTASEAGIEPGDFILQINKANIRDYIDFLFFSQEDTLTLKIKKKDNRIVNIRIKRDFQKPLGIEPYPIRPRGCKCRCIFCFVDQMPKGLRKNLYFKDDDYRLSFLYGNYISMTNLSERDWIRIKNYRLSPLFVSVHTTDPDLRAFMMGIKEAAHIMENLNKAKEINIQLHTQIVVCPKINDGKQLRKTIEDLASYYPTVKSVAVVPVGLTSHRKNLFPISQIEKSDATNVIEIALELYDKFKSKFGTGFVFLADEFFIKAEMKLPGYNYYEEFPQLEDGIGMIRSFEKGLENIKLNKSIKASIVTGTYFAPFLERFLKKIKVKDYEILPIENRTFGKPVTVTGLLCAKDIIHNLHKARYNLILIPDIIFNDRLLTLDNKTIKDIQTYTDKVVRIIPSNPEDFTEFIKKL